MGPHVAREKLGAQLAAGEQLRTRAAEVADILAGPLLDRIVAREPRTWLEQLDQWLKRTENMLEGVFTTRHQLSNFQLAEQLIPQRPADEDARFRQEWRRLDRKLDALRKISQLVEPPPARVRVFLVHGRDHVVRDAFTLLLESFDLQVLRWRDAAHATGSGAPSTLDVVRAGMDAADAVVVLLTPDDVGQVRPDLQIAEDGRHEIELTGQPRLNVVFEAGMALGINPDHVVLVQVGSVRPMSDTSGLNVIRLQDTEPSRLDLRKRLATAGLDVTVNDTDEAPWRSIPNVTATPGGD